MPQKVPGLSVDIANQLSKLCPSCARVRPSYMQDYAARVWKLSFYVICWDDEDRSDNATTPILEKTSVLHLGGGLYLEKSVDKFWFSVTITVIIQVVVLFMISSNNEISFALVWMVLLLGWAYALIVTNVLVVMYMPPELAKGKKYKILGFLVIAGSLYLMVPYINAHSTFTIKGW